MDSVAGLVLDVVTRTMSVDKKYITAGSNTREHYFARMVVAHELKERGFSIKEICPYVGVTCQSAVRYQIKGYAEERTPYFRVMAKEVQDVLCVNNCAP